MKVTVLNENSTCRDDLLCEHGLSLYIETGTHRILFDAGQTDAFARNAQVLGIDLRQVDFAVLSHGHYDHSGGLQQFLQINQTAPIYLRRDAFIPHHNADGKYIGIDPALQNSKRLILTDDRMEIAPGLCLHSCNDLSRPFPTYSFGLTALEDGQHKPDGFLHEQYLLIEENGKTVCISGCSHKGILNIARWFQPDVLIGGFHFMKLDPQTDSPFLTEAARQLLACSTVYYTGHCTGDGPYAFLKAQMGDRLHPLSTGTVLEI